MTPTELLPLHHSWPLYEEARRFELGHILSSAVIDLVEPTQVGRLGVHHAGCWECDLRDNSLIWSGGVYDIFGIPRGDTILRDQIAKLYADDSRVAMERLRSYAIRHRRGFTLDAEIQPLIGDSRWIRLICAPVCKDDRVVRLHGLKVVI